MLMFQKGYDHSKFRNPGFFLLMAPSDSNTALEVHRIHVFNIVSQFSPIFSGGEGVGKGELAVVKISI